MYLVSACLCGYSCRYDKVLCRDPQVRELILRGLAVPVCPEVLGGLSVPRAPAEIWGGDGEAVLDGRARVVTSQGQDVTKAYLEGAERSLSIGLQAGCTSAILKARSPSCGNGSVYDGSFTHTLAEGDGVLAALLRRHGFEIKSL